MFLSRFLVLGQNAEQSKMKVTWRLFLFSQRDKHQSINHSSSDWVLSEVNTSDDTFRRNGAGEVWYNLEIEDFFMKLRFKERWSKLEVS